MTNQVRLITNDRPSAAATDQSRKVSRGKEKTTVRITPRRGIPRRIDAVITLSLRGVLPAVILLGATVPTFAGYTTINISSYLNGNISTNVSGTTFRFKPIPMVLIITWGRYFLLVAAAQVTSPP